MESLLVEAHDRGDRAFGYEAWRAEGAPDAPLCTEFAASSAAARERRPQDTPRLDKFVALYAQGDDVDPLIAIERPQRLLSSGEKALIVIDGRHRAFAARAETPPLRLSKTPVQRSSGRLRLEPAAA
jgi:hypothetical protein